MYTRISFPDSRIQKTINSFSIFSKKEENKFIPNKIQNKSLYPLLCIFRKLNVEYNLVSLDSVQSHCRKRVHLYDTGMGTLKNPSIFLYNSMCLTVLKTFGELIKSN